MHAGGVGQGIKRTGFNGVNGFTRVEVVQISACQAFTVFGIHDVS